MTPMKAVPVFAAALVAGLTLSVPAKATVSIECSGLSSSAAVSLLLGAGPVPNFIQVSVAVGDRLLTTVAGQPGEQVTVAQAYDDGEIVRVDLVDLQATKQVAAIRILRADDKAGPFQIGYVQVDDDLPVAISCEGP